MARAYAALLRGTHERIFPAVFRIAAHFRRVQRQTCTIAIYIQPEWTLAFNASPANSRRIIAQSEDNGCRLLYPTESTYKRRLVQDGGHKRPVDLRTHGHSATAHCAS